MTPEEAPAIGGLSSYSGVVASLSKDVKRNTGETDSKKNKIIRK